MGVDREDPSEGRRSDIVACNQGRTRRRNWQEMSCTADEKIAVLMMKRGAKFALNNHGEEPWRGCYKSLLLAVATGTDVDPVIKSSLLFGKERYSCCAVREWWL